MKDFEITVSLKGNELFIIEEHTTGIRLRVKRCSPLYQNYIEVYK